MVNASMAKKITQTALVRPILSASLHLDAIVAGAQAWLFLPLGRLKGRPTHVSTVISAESFPFVERTSHLVITIPVCLALLVGYPYSEVIS